MPIFHRADTHQRFFFIHIPRTAGRFLKENFTANGYDIEHHLTKEILKDSTKMANYVRALSQNVENAHVHFSIYNKWKSIKDLPSIAVVRAPVDKFLSGSFFLTQNFNPSSWDNWRSFQTMLPACMSMHANNWWLPQHEFVSSNTKIWKYEDGFGKNFCDWISNILSINFSIKTPFYTRVIYDQSKLVKTKALVNNIKKFYHKDFEDFNY